MNVCVINNLYPPYVRGGAEQVVLKTVEGLLADGHTVTVITTTPQGDYCERVGDRLTICRFRPKNLFFYTDAHLHGVLARVFWHIADMFHIGAAMRVRRILERERPDVVHTHNLMGMSFLIPRVIRSLGIRHIHTVHDVQLVEPSGIIRKKDERSRRYTGRPVRAYSAVMRLLLGSPDVVISPSQFLLNFYESRGFFPRSRRVVLRNPVTSVAAAPARAVLPHIRFLYLGQVEEHKGVVFLAETFLAFLREPGVRAELHIAGTGSQIDRIAAMARGNPQIVLHGKVERSELAALFASADVTVVPSLCYENSPTVIFESFSFGVPVLASNVEGIAELIREGENGYTFATEDAAMLLQKLRWCAAHRAELELLRGKTGSSLTGLSQGEYVNKLLGLYTFSVRGMLI
jgi:glycosyltransferase involved in cell wall biosynthesis